MSAGADVSGWDWSGWLPSGCWASSPPEEDAPPLWLAELEEETLLPVLWLEEAG